MTKEETGESSQNGSQKTVVKNQPQYSFNRRAERFYNQGLKKRSLLERISLTQLNQKTSLLQIPCTIILNKQSYFMIAFLVFPLFWSAFCSSQGKSTAGISFCDRTIFFYCLLLLALQTLGLASRKNVLHKVLHTQLQANI